MPLTQQYPKVLLPHPFVHMLAMSREYREGFCASLQNCTDKMLYNRGLRSEESYLRKVARKHGEL